MPEQKTIREILEKLIYGLSINSFKQYDIDQALSAISALVNETVEDIKRTYEHRRIKVGNSYVKEVDARYNAGYNDAKAEIRQRLAKIMGGKEG